MLQSLQMRKRECVWSLVSSQGCINSWKEYLPGHTLFLIQTNVCNAAFLWFHFCSETHTHTHTHTYIFTINLCCWGYASSFLHSRIPAMSDTIKCFIKSNTHTHTQDGGSQLVLLQDPNFTLDNKWWPKTIKNSFLNYKSKQTCNM